MSYWTSGVFQVVGTAPYAEVMMITPPIAKAWLKLNKNNRKIQPYRVKIYMDAIRNGTWHAHGQGITFDVNRKLADGQHRLEAIVASNVAAPLTVFFNAKEEAVDGIDAGQERSHAQRMHMAFPQMVNATAVAAIARHIRVGTRTDGHVSKVPFSEVLETYEKYMPGVDFVKENIAGVRGFKRASVMAAISIAYCQNPQVIEALVKRAIDPTGHQHGDPALALRQYVMFQLPVKKETIRTQVSRVLRACKAAIQNEQLVQLKEYEGIWKFFGLDKPTE